MAEGLLDAWRGTVEIDGHEVARFRSMRGLSPAQLAAAATVGQSTVEKWEAGGVVRAHVEGVRAVAAALAVRVEELLTTGFRQSVQRRHQKAGARPGRAVSDHLGPASALTRLFQLPTELPDFLGREREVREVTERLTGPGRCVGLSSALLGMGGVGKTTLAVRIAHAVKGHFPDAQLFVDLRGMSERPVPPAEVMARFIRAFLGEVPRLPETEEDLLPVYRSTLAGRRALVVLDNAKDASQVRNLIAGDRTAFLITSRLALPLDGVPSVRVDVMTPEQSLALLRGIVGPKGTDDELRAVVSLCDHLPLAVRVAGDFLRLKGDWTVPRYVEALGKERLRWLRMGGEERDVGYVLKLSSAQLVRDNPDLALRWHYLADWPADFAVAAAAAAWDMDAADDAVLSDLSDLVDRSMVLYDERTQRYRLHDLMKPIAGGLFA